MLHVFHILIICSHTSLDWKACGFKNIIKLKKTLQNLKSACQNLIFFRIWLWTAWNLRLSGQYLFSFLEYLHSFASDLFRLQLTGHGNGETYLLAYHFFGERSLNLFSTILYIEFFIYCTLHIQGSGRNSSTILRLVAMKTNMWNIYIYLSIMWATNL